MSRVTYVEECMGVDGNGVVHPAYFFFASTVAQQLHRIELSMSHFAYVQQSAGVDGIGLVHPL